MNNEITKEEFEETNRKVQEWMHQIEVDTIKKFPLWMRLNYFFNKLSRAVNDGHTDEEINWDYINKMCVENLSPFDYNMYRPVITISSFETQRFDIICASEGVGPWHKHKCKDCGQEFSMDYREVHFYQEKELNLPKRCKDCRAKKKQNSAK